jgi:RimJ/RimL family protein N-acetyltransferase
MTVGLLFDCDTEVAQWHAAQAGCHPGKYDKALGLVDSTGVLIGAIAFQYWNGANVELGYWGRGTLSLGIVRCLSRYAITTFDPARVTVVTSKRNRHLMRSLQKLGFRLEGISRCYYGKKDCNRNTGVRFVLFRNALERLAKMPQELQQCL